MKKDKEWFIKELIGHEVGDYGNYYNSGYEDGLAYALKLAHKLDEPEKIVIPRFVADWWDGDSVTMYGGERINKKYKLRLISNFHDRGLGDYLSKVEDWLDENDSTFLDLVNGKPYEVEKEKLYYVIIPTKCEDWMYYYLDGLGGIDTTDDLKNIESHTEAFIRFISDDLWPFAVEVAE